jgi:V/A-type H+-transporting ATPase subunit I
MRTPRPLDIGQDLVKFYVTPGYWLWDPSTTVFVSFSIFFAMIVADAGYGALLGLGILYFWRMMGRSDTGRKLRVLFSCLAAASVLYGVLIGSYFGLEPSDGSILSRLRIFDLENTNSMMAFSILVGIGHIIFANVMDAWRQRTSAGALVPLGWVAILIGGTLMGFGTVAGEKAAGLRSAGTVFASVGALGVFLFSAREGNILKRIAMGFLGLTKLTSAFGDVMSYLRLFALGLASGSLAMAFNDLASQVSGSVRGVGLFFGLLILVFGHGINVLLGISSGFIHGLRLNLIEFFNWGIAEEGTQFRAFAKKEDRGWN